MNEKVSMQPRTPQSSINEVANRLSAQVGVYELGEKNSYYEAQASAQLYKGLTDYQASYQRLVKAHQIKYPHNNPAEAAELINNGTYFRDMFVRYIAVINGNTWMSYQGDPALRSTHPESATIRMQEFLGKEGLELYKLALQEEMNSKEFMHAVLDASTKNYQGARWAERPIVIVGGPSASGKSFAADAAIQEASRFLPKEGSQQGNKVIFVDGGIVRETSQMRKLVIQAANNKGFTGVKDLQSKSNILEQVKTRILNHAAQSTFGMVIPETFSKPHIARRLLKLLFAIPNARVIFTRVVGKEPNMFRRVVAFMGSRRAWKTADFKSRQLELNAKSECESKAYGAGGFIWGVLGSRLAEKWYKKVSPKNLSMAIKNDLILVVEDPKDTNQWRLAEVGEKGKVTKLVSERAFKEWQKNSDIPLPQFISTKITPPLIKLSAELKVEIARAAVREKAKQPGKNAMVFAVVDKALGNLNPKDKNQVDTLLKDVKNMLSTMKKSRHGLLESKSSDHKVMQRLYAGLKSLSKQLAVNDDKRNILQVIDNLSMKYKNKIEIVKELNDLKKFVAPVATMQEHILESEADIKYPKGTSERLCEKRERLSQLMPDEKILRYAINSLINNSRYIERSGPMPPMTPAPTHYTSPDEKKAKRVEYRKGVGFGLFSGSKHEEQQPSDKNEHGMRRKR